MTKRTDDSSRACGPTGADAAPLLPAPDPGVLLEARGLTKSFPGVKALEGVSLRVRRGEVHAVVGENGAGKSTLMKVLAGLLQPDAGELVLHGAVVRLKHPHDARAHGIAMIHQELMPFPNLTIGENVFMGQEPTGRWKGWIDQARLHREAGGLLEQLGLGLSPQRRMGELTVAEMQVVEVAKALAHRAELVIMDEPTSALSEREAERLFRVVRDLQARGVAVIYISHKLDEVFRLADTVTVLRDGRWVATRAAAECSRDQLIALMVGRALDQVFPDSTAQPGAVVLAVRSLGRAGCFRDVTFELRRGEVLGLAGLMGAGRTDVAWALSGIAPADQGEVLVAGQPVRLNTPRAALAHGIALVSEDRQKYGLVPRMSVAQNLTLACLRRCCRGAFIDHRTETRLATDQLRRFGVKTSGLDQPASHLSGGNQQKLILAKALLTEPRVLILDEPTRGIDVGAKTDVYALISRLAREGLAILLISSELPEVLALSQRLLVMCAGRVTAELDARRSTPEMVLAHATPP